jgi:TRAP-type mannitol/chloroaromatic compound transport system substrate-binding protein
MLCALLGLAGISGFAKEASAATYSTPVLDSAKMENGNYVLNWSMSGTSEKPSGGYDIVIDGVDTNATWRTTGTSRTISGLDAKVAHTFIVEARWNQASPAEYPRSKALTVQPVEAYPAPVLNSARLENGKYVLNWSLPANPTGTPTGGFDIWIDGVDTNATWRATGTSQKISGLDAKVAHTFKLESRWTQAKPAEYPQSNELTVEAFRDTTAPTVAITSPSASTTVTDAQILTIVAGASDDTGVTKVEFYKGGSLIGTDTTNPFSTTLSLEEADSGTFNITAVAYDAAGNSTTSSPVAVKVNIVHVEAYPAPVLDSAKLENGKYILNWSLPANPTGTPAGGYDIWIDGVDSNATWRATGTSQTISGLDTKVAHTFKLESRWNQANPALYPQSNELSVEAFRDTTAPTVAITSPSANTTVTSAQTLNIVASASDDTGVTKVEFYDGGSLIGTDTTNPFSVSLPVTEANNGTHNLTAIAYDAAGNSNKSSTVAVTVNIVTVSEPFPAAVMDSAKLENGKYLLNWSIPSNPTGTPAGGYDIVIDGTDTNEKWRTTKTSAVISGLNAGFAHTFIVEARWTQANPAVYPRSNELSVAADPNASTPPVSGPLKVFPGAEGFGTDSKAGRGGQIIKVTNLNNSGAGSLRDAVSKPGPRIIVFEVAGVINLSSPIVATNPYMTIAGQSAPAPGITLNGYGLQLFTHDILVQHLFVRVTSTTNAGEDDGLRIYRGSNTAPLIYNIVIDHVSIAWGNDENASIVLNSGHDFTYSNCLLGEGHYGLLIDSNIKNTSVMRNLIMAATARFPRLKGGVTANVVNNVLYNWGVQSAAQVGSVDGKNYVSFAGNTFIGGPNTSGGSYGINVYSMVAGSQLYVPESGANRNIATGTLYSSAASGFLTNSPPASASLAGITVLPAQDVEFYIYNNVGARPAERGTAYGDFTDERFISELQARGGSVKNMKKPSWVKPVSNTRVLDAGPNPSGDDDGNGYTNIEELLYQMALKVEGRLN